jgi:hypothetical protein
MESGTKCVENDVFGERGIETKRVTEANHPGNSLIEEFLKRLGADRLEHHATVFVAQPEVAQGKVLRIEPGPGQRVWCAGHGVPPSIVAPPLSCLPESFTGEPAFPVGGGQALSFQRLIILAVPCA